MSNINIDVDIDVRVECSRCHQEIKKAQCEDHFGEILVTVPPCQCVHFEFEASELYKSLLDEVERKHGKQLRDEIELYCMCYIPRTAGSERQ